MRTILGIVGPPGSGKSTITDYLVREFPDDVAILPMDGFHLAGRELERLGRAHRKGAPDTFDVDGYVALLERLRTSTDETVYAPEFRREIEEPIANAIPIPRTARLVITEGNYLLHDAGGWERVRPLLDQAWYIDLDEATRDARLLARHIAFGRTPEAARAWIASTDAPNAALIARGRPRADRLIAL
jgi:pantothenate kinase